MITAIILSAGQARRMGTQKVLLPFGGKTVIEHIVCAIEKGGVEEIMVVTGYEGDRVASALQNTGAQIVFNKEYLTGMLSSVRCGIIAAEDESDAFLIVLGDQPSIRSDIVAKLINEFRICKEKLGVILVPTFDGCRGHPIIVSRHFRDEILDGFDDVGLRGLLAGFSHLVREIPVDQPEILRDMDDREDYANELDALAKAKWKENQSSQT